VSGCLGERVADLADGRLDPAATERALAHVAGCATCRAELDAQRAASAALRSLAPAEPSADLLARLRATGAPDTVPAQGRAASRPVLVAPVPATAVRRPRRRTVVASAASVAVVAALAVVGGSATSVGSPSPAIAPVVDRLADAHSSTTTERMPLTGPRVVSVGLTDPLSAP
jgi:cytochrome c-type biogenesis protein CcmH/NrfG